VLHVTATARHVFDTLASASLRSGAIRRRLAVSVLGALAVGLLAAAPGSHSPAQIKPNLVASGPWLDRFNAWRAETGTSILSENTTYSAGDYNHALYMVQTGQVTHSESTAYPQYTTAGDIASQNSNIFVSSSTNTTDAQSIDWWMGAPFHAMAMMDPRLTTTGFGSYRNSAYSPWQMGAAVNVGQGMTAPGQYPVYFPGNGTTEPLMSYSGNEFPDPTQACPGYTGLPLFVEVGANVATTAGAVHSFTGNGTALTHCVIDSTNPTYASYLKWRGGVIVFPQAPLQPGVRYTVNLTVNTVPYAWSFTVGPLAGGLGGTPLVGNFDGSGKAGLALVSALGVSIVLSTGTAFSKPAVWASFPFYGTKGTLAGDVTGDGKADLVAVNAGQTFVMPSTGIGFGPPQGWSNTPFYGTRGTFLADVTGDGKADLVAVNDSSVWVMPSTGTAFGPPIPWSSALFFGNVTTTIGDVTGDGKADLIAINSNSTWVMSSTGTGFGPPTPWSGTPFFGNVSTMVADVNGDRKADLVAVNRDSAWVLSSTGTAFGAPTPLSGTAFYGQVATLGGDATGDGKADLVAINNGSLWVEPSTGTALSAPVMWF
jgi:FG-GAP-like repeat/Cysteine-rich secretory protein family